ncbi:MAG: hypothetical protein JXR60_01255 [Bacteroidales bacterium]|nr:hypothetical protein [Bacteroidales bacterium]
MKTHQLLFFAFLFAISQLFGQDKIEVKESTERFSVGKVDVGIVNIHQADKKYVEQAWKKLMKRYSGSVKNKAEIFADDVIIKKMSNNTVDVYAIVRDGSEGQVEIVVAVDLGGAFLSRSQHPDKYKLFEEILRDFAVDVSREAVREQAEDEQKALDKLTKEQEKLVSTNESLHKSIEEYKQKITEAESDIEQNLKDQETKKEEIEKQRQIVIEITERERAIK